MRIAKRRVAHPLVARTSSSLIVGSAILRTARLVGGGGGLELRNGGYSMRHWSSVSVTERSNWAQQLGPGCQMFEGIDPLVARTSSSLVVGSAILRATRLVGSGGGLEPRNGGYDMRHWSSVSATGRSNLAPEGKCPKGSSCLEGGFRRRQC